MLLHSKAIQVTAGRPEFNKYLFYKERNHIFVLMKRKEVIKEIIIRNQSMDLGFVLPRDIQLQTETGRIVSVTGIRRCGKTHLLMHTMKSLLERNTDKSRLVYINFEDERLTAETEDLDLIIQSYVELFPESKMEEVYFFFDEIQNVPGWEKFIRRLYDSVSRRIFITGSNSGMLSSDIATSLRGRSMSTELFPLSFSEFLRFRGMKPDLYTPGGKASLINALKEYLTRGGFPEIINAIQPQSVLQDYFYVMLYKDIIERYKVSNVSALKYFLNRLVINAGRPGSFNKIYNELRSAGYRISKDSLYSFAWYAEEAWFSFRMNRFDYSFVSREMSEKKIYIIDNGFLSSLTWQFSGNWGTLLENTVFLHLRRRFGKDIFFYRGKNECDFVLFDRDKPAEVLQVAYDTDTDETLKRETDGLAGAAGYFGLKGGKIITLETEGDAINIAGGFTAETVPAWKWLLT